MDLNSEKTENYEDVFLKFVQTKLDIQKKRNSFGNIETVYIKTEDRLSESYLNEDNNINCFNSTNYVAQVKSESELDSYSCIENNIIFFHPPHGNEKRKRGRGEQEYLNNIDCNKFVGKKHFLLFCTETFINFVKIMF